jgi:hypothetical protein
LHPPPQPFLSILIPPSARSSPAPTALTGPQQTPREAFFESPQQPNTALPCLVPVISPLCVLRRRPALRTPAIVGVAEARIRTGAVARPLSTLLFSRALLPLAFLYCKLSPSLLLSDASSYRVSGSCS